VRFELTSAPDATTVRITHQDVPVEQAEDMATLWAYYLPRLGPLAHRTPERIHRWIRD
jgi:hypothetical protein